MAILPNEGYQESSNPKAQCNELAAGEYENYSRRCENPDTDHFVDDKSKDVPICQSPRKALSQPLVNTSKSSLD
jgi:hypothetical protein